MNTKILQVILVLAIVGCIHHPPDTLCTEVIDGDTFRLGNGELVRLIGIDAPELSQPGGELSREYLSHLILGKKITLERGLEERDKYNRLLHFVYIGNLCVNEEMIKQGYAEARYVSENPIHKYYLQLENPCLHLLLNLKSHLFKETEYMKHWSIVYKDVCGEAQKALFLREISKIGNQFRTYGSILIIVPYNQRHVGSVGVFNGSILTHSHNFLLFPLLYHRKNHHPLGIIDDHKFL